MAGVRQLISYLPSSNRAPAELIDYQDMKDQCIGLPYTIPHDSNQPYEMKSIIKEVRNPLCTCLSWTLYPSFLSSP